jgi:hypothetical protein
MRNIIVLKNLGTASLVKDSTTTTGDHTATCKLKYLTSLNIFTTVQHQTPKTPF